VFKRDQEIWLHAARRTSAQKALKSTIDSEQVPWTIKYQPRLPTKTISHRIRLPHCMKETEVKSLKDAQEFPNQLLMPSKSLGLSSINPAYLARLEPPNSPSSLYEGDGSWNLKDAQEFPWPGALPLAHGTNNTKNQWPHWCPLCLLDTRTYTKISKKFEQILFLGKLLK